MEREISRELGRSIGVDVIGVVARQCTVTAVFCPGFQKGRVPSEKGTFSAVNGQSKGHN